MNKTTKKIILTIVIVLIAAATLVGGWLFYKNDFSFAHKQGAGQGADQDLWPG